MKIDIVGITGYKRSGKDTFCRALQKAFPKVVRLAIADEMRRELAKFLGITTEYIEANKEPYYRKPLQDIAMARRRVDENYWLAKLLDYALIAKEAGARIVVPDIRLPIEATRLRQRFSSRIIRLRRKFPDETLTDTHITETSVDSIDPDEEYTCESVEDVSDMAVTFGTNIGWREL